MPKIHSGNSFHKAGALTIPRLSLLLLCQSTSSHTLVWSD